MGWFELEGTAEGLLGRTKLYKAQSFQRSVDSPWRMASDRQAEASKPCPRVKSSVARFERREQEFPFGWAGVRITKDGDSHHFLL